MVEVGCGVTRGPVDVIHIDYAVGTRQAFDHFVELGPTARYLRPDECADRGDLSPCWFFVGLVTHGPS